jgi:plastocyanin
MQMRIGVVHMLALVLVTAMAGCGSTAPTVDPSFEGGSVTVEAISLQFTESVVNLPTGVPLRLVLDNKDAGVPHNLRVFQGDTEYGKSPTVSGPGLAEVRFGPLPVGRYQFQCEIHPAMLGTVVVGP